jgi:hypothetical protein
MSVGQAFLLTKADFAFLLTPVLSGIPYTVQRVFDQDVGTLEDLM